MFEYSARAGISQYLFRGSGGEQILINNDTEGIIANVIQTVDAAVRVDLGNPSPNNLLLSTFVIGEAITASFLQTFPTFPTLLNESLLYSTLVGDGYAESTAPTTGSLLLPLAVTGPAVLDGVYFCRFQRSSLVLRSSRFSSRPSACFPRAASLVKRAPRLVCTRLVLSRCAGIHPIFQQTRVWNTHRIRETWSREHPRRGFSVGILSVRWSSSCL
jgi:hypothetical protein